MLPTNPLLNATAPAGPHLPVALLRQYAAGTLAPAAQHRVEAHTLACGRCGDILQGLLQSPPATTDQALVQLQLRLRQRMLQHPVVPARLAPRQPRWLAPQLAAAAALLLGLVAGGWWTWQQRHPTPSGGPLPAPTTVSLPPPLVAPPSAAKAGPVIKEAAPSITTARSALVERAAAARPTPLHAAKRPALAARRAPHPAPAPNTLSTPPIAATPPAAAAPVATPAAPAAGVATNPLATKDNAGLAKLALRGRVAKAIAEPGAAVVRDNAMPVGPAIAPAPAGGYGALREKLRREAAEFVPEAPQPRLSGTVQLRLTVGPDGKIQQIKVIQGLREDYDAEAQRLLCEGPAWVPGVSSGQRAAQVVDVAVPF